MTREETARTVVCEQCRAGRGEACFDLRPGFTGLRIKAAHASRARRGQRPSVVKAVAASWSAFR